MTPSQIFAAVLTGVRQLADEVSVDPAASASIRKRALNLLSSLLQRQMGFQKSAPSPEPEPENLTFPRVTNAHLRELLVALEAEEAR